MGLFRNLLMKIGTSHSTYVENSSDKNVVRIISDRYLSDEAIEVITSVVLEGLASKSSLDEIGINVIVYSGVYSPVTLNRIKNGIEVII